MGTPKSLVDTIKTPFGPLKRRVDSATSISICGDVAINRVAYRVSLWVKLQERGLWVKLQERGWTPEWAHALRRVEPVGNLDYYPADGAYSKFRRWIDTMEWLPRAAVLREAQRIWHLKAAMDHDEKACEYGTKADEEMRLAQAEREKAAALTPPEPVVQ